MSALADAPAPRVQSPTGLTNDELRGLGTRRLRRLVTWHGTVAGNDDGRPWWPQAVRDLPLEQRVRMAESHVAFQHWIELERRRVAESPLYFTQAYGHVQPERAGAVPIPFELWEMVEAAAERCIGARSQAEVLELFVREQIVVVLKARQLGLTWLALHFAMWLMSYAVDLPRAKVLALSKREDDAQKLLRRLRKINQLLPPYLRRAEDKETRGSLSRFKLEGRGEAISLVSTPDTARSEQADLFLWDEAAFTRNKQFEDTWTAARPTLGDWAKAIVISTGNGPAEVTGDGQGFAKLFGQALAAQDGMVAVFLPDDVHPSRTKAWRQRERRRFLSDYAFEQEHPRTAEEALRGKQGDKVYSLAGIAAAEKLGGQLDELMRMGELVAPASPDECLAVGIDWGTHTVMLPIWELEGGGLYVPPGALHTFNVEVSEKQLRFHRGLRERVQVPEGEGSPWPLVSEARFDAAGVEQQRVFIRVLLGADAAGEEMRKQWELTKTNSKKMPFIAKPVPVRFNRYKDETIQYLQWLFNRSALLLSLPESKRERWAYLAISPENKELLRQLRALEFDEHGKVVKEDDHGPDALIAGAAPIAAEHRERVTSRPEDDSEAAEAA